MEGLFCLVVWETMIIAALLIDKRVIKKLDPVFVNARYIMQKKL